MRGYWSYLFRYVWPPSVFAGVWSLMGEWQRSDVKDRAILGVFFIPALLSVAGLLVCVAYFVLFKLPSFILSVLGWLLLISIFSGGGMFCYERLRGKKTSGPTHYATTDAYDATATTGNANPGPSNPNTESDKRGNWFDGVRNMKWPR